MIKYRPYWQRIIFLAALLNFVVVFAISLSWTNKADEPQAEELQEVEWVEEIPDDSTRAESAEIPESVETFPEIKFPPIEIPAPPEPTLTEPTPPPAEIPQEKKFATENKPVENKTGGEKEKPADDSVGKLKVLSKVLPRDIVAELMSSGTISEGRALKAGKVVLAVTIGTDGKIKNVEIRRGGGSDENGNSINILSETAAMRWIFEPFKDTDGNTKEIKTQIEFKPEDF